MHLIQVLLKEALKRRFLVFCQISKDNKGWEKSNQRRTVSVNSLGWLPGGCGDLGHHLGATGDRYVTLRTGPAWQGKNWRWKRAALESQHEVGKGHLSKWVELLFWCLSFQALLGLNLFLCFFLFFNWRIIALQNCVGFCQTSTWISHRHTYVPALSFSLSLFLMWTIFKDFYWICYNIVSVLCFGFLTMRHGGF